MCFDSNLKIFCKNSSFNFFSLILIIFLECHFSGPKVSKNILATVQRKAHCYCVHWPWLKMVIICFQKFHTEFYLLGMSLLSHLGWFRSVNGPGDQIAIDQSQHIRITVISQQMCKTQINDIQNWLYLHVCITSHLSYIYYDTNNLYKISCKNKTQKKLYDWVCCTLLVNTM